MDDRSIPRFVAALAIALALVPCACRRATEADCEQIIDKLVELELKGQGITDPSLIESRKAETKAKKRAELVNSCVGKRISGSAMECIKRAQTPDEVTDKCLR